MIYIANNNPLVLTEADADSFLESVGVELFDDEIAINGTIYEGAHGEFILEGNGIFLYEDCIVLEGEAAKKVTKQDYMSRKAKEKADLEEDLKKRNDRRYGFMYMPPGDKSSYALRKDGSKQYYRGGERYYYTPRSEDDRDRDLKSSEIAVKELKNRDRRYRAAMRTKYRYTGKYAEYGDERLKKSKEAYERMLSKDNTHFIDPAIHDTVNRHIRRHPKQYAKKSTNESTIFSDIEII